MEEIIRAIKLLREKITHNKRIWICLTPGTIKALVKKEIELGICESKGIKIDWDKHPIGYFAGYPVSEELYNAVVLVDANAREILEKIRLSDNLF